VKNPVFPILLAVLSFSFSLPANNGSAISPGITPGVFIDKNESAALYASLDLEKYNLSREAFDWAWSGYQKLLQQNRIGNSQYLTICDFSQSSRQKRFYLIDLTRERLILNTYVAHGRNSGGEFATRFSNNPKSLQSSLGFYVTAETYYGEHGLSLKIRGLERGINDKALERRIVIHGADYAEPGQIKSLGYLGRSYGCPALPKHTSSFIINTIKNGSCFFIYYPSNPYKQRSKILND
jgi:hypothetical protein